MPKARIAVLGAGWWSQGWHLPHLSRNDEVHIVAVVDPDPKPRSAISELQPLPELAERYSGGRHFSSLDELLASGLELDGCIVCTSHASHFSLGVALLERGVHVLMEKPMTTDPAEAVALAAAVGAKPGCAFMVNNTANWRRQAVTAAEWIAAGSVGRVEHVCCVMHSPLLWLFDDPANIGWTTTTGSMTGNGFGWGQLSHLLAWVFKVCGLTPVDAFAAMGRSARSGADLTDAAVVRCQDGETITVSGAATVPGNAHAEADEAGGEAGGAGEAAPHCGKHISIRVFGSEGMLCYEGDDQDERSGELQLRRRDGGFRRVEGFRFENYEPEGTGPESLLAFVDACLGREHYNGADAAVGLQTVRCLDAMYRSAKSGKAEACAPGQ